MTCMRVVGRTDGVVTALVVLPDVVGETKVVMVRGCDNGDSNGGVNGTLVIMMRKTKR